MLWIIEGSVKFECVVEYECERSRLSLSRKIVSFPFLKFYREIRYVPVSCCIFYRSAVYNILLQGGSCKVSRRCRSTAAPPSGPAPPPASSPAQTTCLSKPLPGTPFFHASQKFLVDLVFSVQENKTYFFPRKKFSFCKKFICIVIYHVT
jgi:hypothetical protein